MAKFHNLAGKKFNKLTVTKNYTKRVSSDRIRTFWVCLCDCGKTIEVQCNSLRNNHTKSCGCLKKGLPSKEAEYNARFRNYKISAAKRNYDWQLNREEFESIVTKNCYWCGDQPEYKEYRNGKGKWGAYMNGIDRLDNSKGYTIENSKPCCSTCNRIKGDLDRKTLLDKMKKINKLHGE